MPNYNYPDYAPWYSQRSKIKKVVIEEGVTNIGGGVFRECSNLTSITIPNSVTSIGKGAFSGCSGLTSVTIPNSVTSIGSSAFEGCTGLTSITIPNSVTSIEGSAFSGCSGLTSVTIPNSVTSIESYAFLNCSGLTSITIPNSVTSIGSFAFLACSGLTSIIVEQGNIKYDSRNDCNAIIETKSNTLISGCKNTIIPNSVTSIGWAAFCFCTGLTSVTIPNSVTSIGPQAFYYCTDLTSVTIPNSVTSIGPQAFEGCTDLTSVTIGNSVTSIGSSAFRYCSSLTSITIPNSVTSIGPQAFEGCTDLTSVTIGNSVTSIGSSAFEGCSSLTSITCEASTPPSCFSSSFGKVNKAIPVYVPANSVDAYKKANVWKDFTNIQAIPDNQKIADAVVAMINAIGKIEYTDACKGKIDEANNAYNALTDEQKTLVTNLEVLTNAQQTYDNLKAAAEKLIADKAAVNKYKSEIIAIIEALVKDDDSDAVKEIIRKAISNIEALEYDVAITLDNNKAKVQSFVTSTDEAVENQRAEDQKTNGIEELEFADKYNIYDLNGRKITNSMLKSGLYIRNGEKVVVK